MSDVRKWEIDCALIRDAEGRLVVTHRVLPETDPRFVEMVFYGNAKRQIEALPLLVAAVECRMAFRELEWEKIGWDEFGAVLRRHGLDHEGHGLAQLERLEAQALAILRGDDAAEGVQS